MPASDALAMQAIFRQELDSAPWEHFFDYMVESMQHPTVGDALIPKHWTPQKVTDDLRLWSRAARTYYVSHDMMRLAIGAMESLPNDATVMRESPMSPYGFMWLPSPLRMYDIRGRILPINAILWATVGNTLVAWLLTDKYDPINVATDQARGIDSSHSPRLTPYHVLTIKFGEPLPVAMSMRGQKPIPPEANVGVQASPDGKSISWYTDDAGMIPEDMEIVQRPSDEGRFLTVVWRLMRQTIVDVREEPVDKRARRLAEKHLRPERHVTVIALRKREYHGQGNREWVLDHQILVDGYWRRQWYGSGEDRWSDVIYIHPHTRGPDGTPLVITDKVRALLR